MPKLWVEKNTGYTIPDSFFVENPLPEVNTGSLMMFQMDLLDAGQLGDAIDDFVYKEWDDGRREEDARNKSMIMETDDPQELVRLMRKIKDVNSRRHFAAKVLEDEDKYAPEIIRRLETSAFDPYIETAVVALAKVNDKYIDELISKYRNVVSPHARAEISALFAYRNRFETLPELMKMYRELYFSGNESEMRCAMGVLYSIYSLMRHP